jgi:cyanate lyase
MHRTLSSQETESVGAFDSFEELFQRAEERPSYWVELAKLEFTEEMLARLKELGINKSEFAARLGAKPAFVTRLLSGRNNFTLETMVRVARALECEFRCHLRPNGTKKSRPSRRPCRAPVVQCR